MEYAPYIVALSVLVAGGVLWFLRQIFNAPHILHDDTDTAAAPSYPRYERTEFHLVDGTTRAIFRLSKDDDQPGSRAG